jgi:predicted acylesterase/phospholipase RssA
VLGAALLEPGPARCAEPGGAPAKRHQEGPSTGDVPSAPSVEQVGRKSEPGGPDAVGDPQAGPELLSLTISGGVSLGVYQAGFLYLVAEAVKRSQGQLQLHLVTGASAGSVNGLITALESCLPGNDSPTGALGWQTWVDIGHRELFDEADVTSISTFTRRPLVHALERIRRVWSAGLPRDCDVVVGATVTRLIPQRVRLRADLLVPRQEEKLAIRIRGRGLGRPPAVENYVEPEAGSEQAYLPLRVGTEDDRLLVRNFAPVQELIFASGAFPFAFAPQPLHHCLGRRRPQAGGGGLQCPGRVRRDLFVDGGVFDNNPLRFARRLADLGLVETAADRAGWRDLDSARPPGQRSAAQRLTYVYVDPDTTAFPPMTGGADRLQQSPSLLPLAMRLTGDFVQTARAKELAALVEQNPELLQQVRLTRNQYPTISAHLGAFLGFFEREFRRFDFYLGMYDAHVEFIRRRGTPSLLPFDVRTVPAGQLARIPAGWRPFACLYGWFEPGGEHLRPVCADPGLRDFRILLQVALDRVYTHCRGAARQHIAAAASHHCWRARAGATVPRVAGVRQLTAAERSRRAGESHFDHTMRLLHVYRFAFRDLELDPDEAGVGRVAVRRKFLKMLRHLADAQPDAGDRLLLLTAGRAVINHIAYEPPKHWGYVVLGTMLELGASVLPLDWNDSWARLNVAVQSKGLLSLLTPSPDVFSATASVGLELEPLFAMTPLWQPMLGLRAAYQLSNRDDFGTGACTAAGALADKRNCSQLLIQNYYALTLAERLRIQATLELFPEKRSFDDKHYDLLLGFGFQFFWPRQQNSWVIGGSGSAPRLWYRAVSATS